MVYRYHKSSKFQKRSLFLVGILLSFLGWSQKTKISEYGFNGSDDTAFVLQAINSPNDTIVFDKQVSPWVVRPLQFKGLKNKVLLFEAGTILQAKKGAFLKSTDALVALVEAEEVQILGNDSKWVMQKTEYTDGEWRHGLSLRSCKNINVVGLRIEDSGGDGIYIGTKDKGGYSENITISGVTCSNNKRQGMSVISVQNLKVTHSVFEDTVGTLPGAGVDLEPNSKEDRLVDIEFRDCIFRNNDHAGVLLALDHLQSDSLPVKVCFVNCVVQNNHSKDNKYIASELVFNAHKTNPVKGEVIFENCLVENSKWGLFYSRKTNDAYNVTFKDCTAQNICLDNSYPAIYLEVPDYRQGSYTLGGYVFKNLFLAYESEVPFFQVRGSNLHTLSSIADIYGDITIVSRSIKEFSYVQYNPDQNRNLNLRVTQKRK